ncbi:MAG TPA: lipoyl synthase [bacterium]|nr:lipoyl synthase [bacterium]
MKRKIDRLPHYVLNPCRSRAAAREVKVRLRRSSLHTVCESARCPNITECFSRPTAAFLIMGNRCSRACRFCAVTPGSPLPLDPAEPQAVASAAAELGLRHVVVTSVTRDDLADGGAAHFASVILALKSRLPAASIEVLTPDFRGDPDAVRTVMAAAPHVFNHNLETVSRLYPAVRPAADYLRSLAVLSRARELACEAGAGTVIKSGLMVGLGEDKDEVKAALNDLAAAGCAIVTIGQYLQPRRGRLPVARFWEPREYDELSAYGRALGLTVFAGPLVRSSYLADKIFDELAHRTNG